jgi:hypothetical protein
MRVRMTQEGFEYLFGVPKFPAHENKNAPISEGVTTSVRVLPRHIVLSDVSKKSIATK